MLSRGHYIGKIVDDIAGLKYQVKSRNKLNLTDLSNFTENFFKELLNTVYGLNLNNLNQEQANNAALDLGDKNLKKAFQITTTITSTKIIDTLTKITPEQLAIYDSIKVLIVGEKQGSYTIPDDLITKVGFDVKSDIIDLDDLLKDIMVLDSDPLEALYNQFSREFRTLKIEFEEMDSDGNYESSIFNRLEQQPNLPPQNLNGMKDYLDEHITKKSIKKLYRKLARIPRASRELIAVIGEYGKFKQYGYRRDDWGILLSSLRRTLRMTEDELEDELLILIDEELLYLGETEVEDRMRKVIAYKDNNLNAVVSFAKEEKLQLKTLFNTMNFTVLDK